MNNMAKNVRITIGSLFEVTLEKKQKGYFQFIGLDLTQLNSDVIRVFKKKYPLDQPVSVEEIINNEVDFHAHTLIRAGLIRNLWSKIGSHSLEEDIALPQFRSSNDAGRPEIKVSDKWKIWSMNNKFKLIGYLIEPYTSYDLGLVFPPDQIIHKMNTGKFKLVYPS